MTEYINALLDYARESNLIESCDRLVAFNKILEVMELDAPDENNEKLPKTSLADILNALTDDAVSRGVCDDSITARDLFDTKLMGALTPMPREVRKIFSELYSESPRTAADWFYKFSCDTNYIRTDRIKKDLRWKYYGRYGELDISINLSKPEKDPRAIAAARLAPQTAYPKCQLCAENEGYAGRINHPARQNHRLIPIEIAGSEWYFQYSPYVYYNEHCIVFNGEHVPMKIDRACFEKLFDFISILPHYFLGSNADLPIVGGSILSHDHFQGGNFEFAMARAGIEREISFSGYENIKAGIVNWPMSVIRLNGKDRAELAGLAEKILNAWRNYSDESAFIFAETAGEKHNTITPIARRRGENYELDLVLRNNITSEEHPLGVYHPHANLHHIKKENIGLIEVMGLAVLPSRLKTELEELKNAMLEGGDLRSMASVSAHADWAYDILSRREFSADNADDVLREETGRVFEQVLEDAGVYKNTASGRAAFMRFIDSV